MTEDGKAHAPVALVVGAGDALGSAVARRFAKEGYNVVVVRRTADKLEPLVQQIRSSGGCVRAVGADARNEEQMVNLFSTIEREEGPIETVVFNVGPNVEWSILETDAKKYFKVWELACYAGFLVGREAAKVMVPRKRGTICSPARPHHCAARAGSQRSPAASTACAPWRRAWRKSWGRKAFMWHISSSTARSTPSSSRSFSRSDMR